MKLDKTNSLLLNYLQTNCRLSYTELAKRVGLSVDSVKKRIDKLLRAETFTPKIHVRPRHLGFPDIVEVKVKLRNCSHEEEQKFIDFLVAHPRVSQVIQISSAWDYTVVIIAKDSVDLGRVTSSIKGEFARHIADWSEALTKSVYKFENYDVVALMEAYE